MNKGMDKATRSMYIRIATVLTQQFLIVDFKMFSKCKGNTKVSHHACVH